MKTPTLTTVDRLPLTDIEVRRRLRPVSEAAVESLIASITELGVMKDAIHVRKRKDGKHVLIAGAHRLEAASRMGWLDVQAKVWADVTDDWALLMEVDDNIAGAELSPLDTAIFLAHRKAIYERLHPEAKRGVAGALARWDDATANIAVASFAKATAEKFSMSERKVFMLLAAGARLNPIEADQLRSAPRQVTLKDLGDLSKLGVTFERASVINAVTAGKTVAEARRAYKLSEAGVEAPVKDPVEAEFQALSAAWRRASMAVRRRFFHEFSDDIAAMEGGAE